MEATSSVISIGHGDLAVEWSHLAQDGHTLGLLHHFGHSTWLKAQQDVTLDCFLDSLAAALRRHLLQLSAASLLNLMARAQPPFQWLGPFPGLAPFPWLGDG
jgi:hypothetical protein